MRFSKYCFITLLVGLSWGLFAGGAGEQGQASSAPAPGWISRQPADGEGKSYFVASGNSRDGNESQAQDAAALDLINQINRYLGVSINSESTATELSTANDYQALIVGVVKQNAKGEVAGLRVAERYIRKDKQGVTVFLLGEYRTADLEKEKSKRAALILETEAAVTVPEAKGMAAEKSGQLFEAVRAYLEAASASANGQVRNSDVKFERNIQNSLRALSRLQLTKVSGPATATARKAFDQDFLVAINDIQSGVAIASADITASFREYSETGKFHLQNQAIKSDALGQARIRLSAPLVVGSEKVSFSLDLSAYIRSIDNLQGKQKSLVDSVLEAAGGKRVSFDFVVQSMARAVPIAALILELDEKGAQSGSTRTITGIQQKLSAAGFKLAPLAVSSNFLIGKSDQEIHVLLKDVTAGKADRIAYGTAKILDLDDRGADGIFAKASAEITVIEVKTGSILLSFSLLANARGSDKAGAETGAFQKLGLDIGDKLARDLP